MLKLKSYNKKFAILGFPRSGTTQLASIFSYHPDLSCYQQPFSLHKICNHPEATQEDIKKATIKIFKANDGLKETIELTEKNYWIRKAICDLPLVKIFYTERKNILRQVISFIIASELKIWQADQIKNKFSNRQNYLKFISKIGPISLDRIDNLISIAIETNEFVKKELKSLHKDVFYISYEDFYFGKSDYQKKIVKNMFDCIDAKKLFTNQMKIQLRKGRLNNEKSYLKIKNVREIDENFSQYGSLLNKKFI